MSEAILNKKGSNSAYVYQWKKKDILVFFFKLHKLADITRFKIKSL